MSGSPWYYYVLMLPLMIAFVYIPVGLAAVLCLEILYRVPGKRMLIVGVTGLLVIAAAVWFFWSMVARPESDLLTPRWFQDMLGRLQLTEQRLLPSWWLSSGVLETAHGAWSEGVLFLTLLVSNALFCRQLAVWTAAQLYRRTYSRVAGTGHSCKRARITWLDHALGRMLGFLPPPVRLMLIKDLRLFRRDPVQWSQFLILFALLGLYFLNVRRFTYTVNYSAWVSMVSFMNLSVVGLLMSTFTTRFIFPMISLGKPAILAAWPAALAAGHHPLEQVPVCHLQPDRSLFAPDSAERFDAPGVADDARQSPVDVHAPLSRVVGDCRGPERAVAQPP